MQIAVVTAATGKSYGDLRPEAAMLKAALLYADGVQIVSGKVPALLIQMSEQMRGWDELWAEFKKLGGADTEMVDGLIERLRQNHILSGAEMIEGLVAKGHSPSAIFETIGTAWQKQVLPRFQAAPLIQHQDFVRDFLSDFVASYARRMAVPAAPLVRAANDLQLAVRAGVAEFDLLEAHRTFEMNAEELLPEIFERLFDTVVEMATNPRGHHPIFDDRARTIARLLAGEATAAEVLQVGLAQELIVSLESFPMASMDVVLDVRERLKPSLTRFHAAMAEATRELADFPIDAGFAAAVDDLRTRKISPAVQEIDENLEELGARPTLLRGWPKVAAGTIGLAAAAAVKAPELAQLAPLLAGASVAFTTELRQRNEFQRQRERNQFFFLHAAEGFLAEAIEDTNRR